MIARLTTLVVLASLSAGCVNVEKDLRVRTPHGVYDAAAIEWTPRGVATFSYYDSNGDYVVVHTNNWQAETVYVSKKERR